MGCIVVHVRRMRIAAGAFHVFLLLARTFRGNFDVLVAGLSKSSSILSKLRTNEFSDFGRTAELSPKCHKVNKIEVEY